MNIFKIKLELTSKEKQLENIVISLLSAQSTKKQIKIELTTTTCLLVNDEKHFKVKIDSEGIVIQNTTFATKERLREKFTDHLKKLIIDKINKETDETILEMNSKEMNIIENIEKLINTNKYA